MTDWIGLGIIVVIVLGAIAALSFLGKPYEVTSEEFEKRAEEGMGLLGASVMGLQKMIEPQVEKAVEVLQDYRAGHYDGEQESGDDLEEDAADEFDVEPAAKPDNEHADKISEAETPNNVLNENESANKGLNVSNISKVEEHDA